MLTKNAKQKLAALLILSSALADVSARAATDLLPMVQPPTGFNEGTETQITADQMGELLPWATTTETALKELLEATSSLSYSEARDTLLRGIREVILASAPKRTELLTRYVLNRALLVHTEIVREADTSLPGVVDMQVRLMKLSVGLALKYYASDLAYLNGRFVDKKTDLAGLPYAGFGIDYAQFLMSIDQSLFDASAQYNVGIQALGLLQWDLYRDQDRLLLAPVIAKVNRFLKMAPEKAPGTDAETVKWVRKVKAVYLSSVTQAIGLLKQAGKSVPELEKPPVPAVRTPPFGPESVKIPNDGAVVAQDGTVVIFLPRFVYAGTPMRISERSVAPGACLVAGIQSVYASVLISDFQDYRDPTIMINRDGKIAGSYNYNSGSLNSAISVLICKPSAGFQTSGKLQPQVTQNSDGTISIVRPKISSGGHVLPFSAASNADGLCSFFGYGKSRNLVKDGTDHRDVTLEVGQDGSIYRGYFYNSATTNSAVESIACEVR